ncbi:MAG: tRNA (adenosine(37)-N6)-threonylcarbamoyltransferase complex transferase subunit TsaD [Bacteroidales bacterium]|nr:tRNA (adenosine(37)-N6)-threonylcarbamoyltransferase complex transferase subunit TsaD [Bacteroidales bacterium]
MHLNDPIYILGIESSCDDTSASVINRNKILANKVSNQKIHENYGGVVPELASRAHQQNIIPVVHSALEEAGISKDQLSAIAFTRGPGLLGSLLVGVSFAKAFAMGLHIPIIEVDHLHAHIMAHFIDNGSPAPEFPFLCLTVSGGHSQIVKVNDYNQMQIIGKTIDDAAGETFDKAAKIMGLPYPGGPVIDKLAQSGDGNRFRFSKPKIKDLDYSFSGLKTSVLYFIRDELKKDPNFIEKNKHDLSASLQRTIIEILLDKLKLASRQTGIKEIAIAGGVSANSGLRKTLEKEAVQMNWKTYIPEFQFSTDNAAMISIVGYYKYLNNDFSSFDIAPYSRK